MLINYKKNEVADYTLLLLRVSIAIYLIYSGFSGTLLGIIPQIEYVSASEELRIIQITIGLLFLTGLFTRINTIVTIGLFVFAFFIHGLSALDQIMIVGICVMLFLRGSSKFSINKIVFDRRAKFLDVKNIASEKLSFTALQISFGANLIWLGMIEKIFAPEMFAAVLDKYDLIPADVDVNIKIMVFAAGLIEIAIGLFYLLDIRMKMMSMLLFGVLIFTVVTFQESVLSHIMMFTISFVFIMNNKDSIAEIMKNKIFSILKQIKKIILLRMYED